MIADLKKAKELNEVMARVQSLLNQSVMIVNEAVPDESARDAHRYWAAEMMKSVYDFTLEPLHRAHPELVPPELRRK